ncbi:MAG: VOC family protein [Kordiimonadaceae bacterium]|jgi:predicted lactoylglutathione lyase|nr:VOC family protein [Kordiimonadaceae bacterium]
MIELDHINLYVNDVSKSRAFYEKLLPPLGLPINREFGDVAVGFGNQNYAAFALVHQSDPIQVTHIAFRVDTRQDVDNLYKLALSVGGTDNGPPGVREHYHEHYYAAFVYDLDGHNLEFVCHNAP